MSFPHEAAALLVTVPAPMPLHRGLTGARHPGETYRAAVILSSGAPARTARVVCRSLNQRPARMPTAPRRTSIVP